MRSCWFGLGVMLFVYESESMPKESSGIAYSESPLLRYIPATRRFAVRHSQPRSTRFAPRPAPSDAVRVTLNAFCHGCSANIQKSDNELDPVRESVCMRAKKRREKGNAEAGEHDKDGVGKMLRHGCTHGGFVAYGEHFRDSKIGGKMTGHAESLNVKRRSLSSRYPFMPRNKMRLRFNTSIALTRSINNSKVVIAPRIKISAHWGMRGYFLILHKEQKPGREPAGHDCKHNGPR